MESFLWHVANRTAETQFIFNLFHLLLAGLTLLVLLHQLRANRAAAAAADRLMALGFFLLVLQFGLFTLHFGAEFFFRPELEWAGFEPVSHGLLASGLLLVVAAFLKGQPGQEKHAARWSVRGCAVVAGLVLGEILLSSTRWGSGEALPSATTLLVDLLVLLALGFGLSAVVRGQEEGRRASLLALGSVGVALLLHSALLFLTPPTGILVWNVEQHVLSLSLFAFAWSAGERSGNLLDRIFVRLNLTFIILASLIMLITVGMEKYQYLRLAEERSLNLAEFLRGHIIYYRERGESLEDIFRHAEVLRRVVVEFGTLPELREVDIYLEGRRASFRYTPDWEVRQEIVSLAGRSATDPDREAPNSFRMIRLPLGSGADPANRVEFLGTMDYINEYIGDYIILIYSLFTIMVGLATGIIGIIVTDTDRRLRRQYTELQETHQQLAHAAKLASIGQLAGGMAHEINTPITSILSLASHLAEERVAPGLAPRQRKSMEVIAQQAERVSKIVGNLLTFARHSHLELGRVELSEVLNAAISLVQYRFQDTGIRLRQEIAADLPPLLGDANRLTEVFVNGLNNAIDAMPAGGALVVRASRNSAADGGVRVEVADTGGGIAPEQLPRVFDPFFTTKEPGRGTGLGLSISHGIVKDHGGEIWVESQPGAGTTLVVTLPEGGGWR